MSIQHTKSWLSILTERAARGRGDACRDHANDNHRVRAVVRPRRAVPVAQWRIGPDGALVASWVCGPAGDDAHASEQADLIGRSFQPPSRAA